ncbi:MAG TPA: hydrogenase accessory protein HypB [Flavobacteriales bacterium]|jgi:hydrogenase nickel incorporation protein HypB|nr:hydrogenase accessory protein HypB [Flavobacteriales bacterium]
MCSTCGCGQDDDVKIARPGQELSVEAVAHDHDNPHHHDHQHHHHGHSHDHGNRVIELERDILHHNDLHAAQNRGYFDALQITTFNLVSSPGSGKTTFLERCLNDLKTEMDFYVIEGDQQTMQDANRIDALQVPVVQVNTGKGCHLDGGMVTDAVKELDPKKGGVMMIENVGNLVCPAMFDLGEDFRIVIISTTEGDDKPLKYPDMFHGSQICIINKIDLIPYLDFDVERTKEYAKKVNPDLIFFEVSATKGDGMEDFYQWLRSNKKS